MKGSVTIGASFRDPSGFLFTRNEKLYRQVNLGYQKNYDHLMKSGLYEKLISNRLLIPHKEVDVQAAKPSISYKILEPEQVFFISYPYEWSFSQLKDAALITLTIQRLALKHGMALKDASAYNIQFHNGTPILIDTLSFELYQEGAPWVAYRQYCQHFLAPLALMAKRDIRLGQLLRNYIDGVPLDLASRLLPYSTRFNFGLMAHLHLHAQALAKYADRQIDAPKKNGRMSRQSLLGLIDNIKDTTRKLEWSPKGTEWGNYYSITNYTENAFSHKKEVISGWISRINPGSVWDLGANNGFFTRLASERGIPSIAFDADPVAVEKNYIHMKKIKEQTILPLMLDLTNPSPAIGWHGQERKSFLERSPADMILALALIHHLAISNNVPLEKLANFFHDLGRWLVIEFVPKSDSQVQKLLASRDDIFEQYTNEDFESAFGERFIIHEKVNVRESDRHLYLMERK
jgi:hypothetical protein